MNGVEITGAILLMIASILLVVIVLMQNTNPNGMGAITGASSDSYYGKNKGRTIDAILNRWTKVIAISFFVLTVGVNVGILLIK